MDDVCTNLEHLFLCDNGLCQNITDVFDCHSIGETPARARQSSVFSFNIEALKTKSSAVSIHPEEIIHRLTGDDAAVRLHRQEELHHAPRPLRLQGRHLHQGEKRIEKQIILFCVYSQHTHIIYRNLWLRLWAAIQYTFCWPEFWPECQREKA